MRTYVLLNKSLGMNVRNSVLEKKNIHIPNHAECVERSSLTAKCHVRVRKQSWKQGNHLILYGVWAPRHFFFNFFLAAFSQKTWKNMISLDRKCLNIHSHVLLPTPWNFLTAAPRVRRPPRATESRCRDLTSARGKSAVRNSLELTSIATGTLVSSEPASFLLLRPSSTCRMWRTPTLKW
jgi:hypothetical protein